MGLPTSHQLNGQSRVPFRLDLHVDLCCLEVARLLGYEDGHGGAGRADAGADLGPGEGSSGLTSGHAAGPGAHHPGQDSSQEAAAAGQGM